MRFTPEQFMSFGLDPTLLFGALGHKPDPWQSEVLHSNHPRILLNCCRQAGKSTTVAALALHQAFFKEKSLVLLLSRAQRQATELFRKVLDFYNALGRPVKPEAESVLRIEFPNESRIIALPGKEANIRSYSGVQLLVIDEAARVPDDLYKSVRPMLAVSGGRLICLSTPFGRRGFFHQEWTDKDSSWLRIEVDASKNPRISKEFLAEELRTLGQSWFDQEYGCSFEALEGLVYPDFAKCVVDMVAPLPGKQVGGIDFGFHNPFAAIWGFLDNQDVLWLTGEHYARQTPLHANAEKIPHHVRWYADPAGANEIAELRAANFVVSKGDNSLRAGIAAITARLQTGRLKVLSYGCPNLIAEAGLYRYPNPTERALPGEVPIDEHNHALGALRYLISQLDHKFLVKFRRDKGSGADQGEQEIPPDPPEDVQVGESVGKRNWWMDRRNPHLWTTV
jgi:hypothetical protein